MTSDIDDSKAPLLEHLIELRTRLIRSALVLLIAFFACFYVASDIFEFLVQPLADKLGENRKMIFTELHEVFFTYVKVAFFAGLFISFPLIANQMWKFIAPGLYNKEKRAFLPFLILTPILFFTGGALVYYVMMPVAWEFFLSFEKLATPDTLPIQLEAKVNEYLSLVMKLIFAFGLSFELPLVLTLMAKAGMASSKGLAEKRKYAIVAAFVAAAVLTPPDPLSQISLAVPIILLYEASIISVRMVEKARGDVQNEDEPDDDDDDDDDELEDTDFNSGR
jgi:sec-independent protein translocase protein TatC